MDNKIGKLIVLESCDGGGKSTQIKIVDDYLKSKNLKSAFIHFPMYGDNEFSDVIAAFLRGEYGDNNSVNPYFVANIYAMDRFLYKPKLEKLLKENDIVLLDRYIYSNAGFQGAKYTDPKETFKIIDWIFNMEYYYLKLPHADLTLFLDVPIKTIEKRLSNERIGKDREYLNGGKDIHEQDMEFQTRVRNIFLDIINENKYTQIVDDNRKKVDCEVMGELLTPKELFYSYKIHIDSVIS